MKTVDLRGDFGIPCPDDYTDEDVRALCQHLESAVRVAVRQIMDVQLSKDDLCIEPVIALAPPAGACQCCDCGDLHGKHFCQQCGGHACDQCGLWMHPSMQPHDYDAEAFCSLNCAKEAQRLEHARRAEELRDAAVVLDDVTELPI